MYLKQEESCCSLSKQFLINSLDLEKMGRGFYGRISDTDRKAFPITELSLRE